MSLDANLGYDEIAISEADWEKGIIDPPTVEQAQAEIIRHATHVADVQREQGREIDKIVKGVLEKDPNAMIKFAQQSEDVLSHALQERNERGEYIWNPDELATILIQRQADRLGLLIKVLS
jgi:hypothetical protein